MILVLNGYPGTGKQTIGQALAPLMGAKLLDIHTVYNLAFALTEFKSPEFMATTEKVEAIAYDLIRNLPADVPVILTTVLSQTNGRCREEWDRMAALGRERPPFLAVHIQCDREENLRRIAGESRVGARKPRDPSYVHRNHDRAAPLMGADADGFLTLDTTELTVEESAQTIADWAMVRR